MIQPATEALLTLSGAAKFLSGRFRPGEKTLHVSTLHRWCGKGIRGHRLETLSFGGGKVTSVEALSRFFAALDGNEVSAPPAGTSEAAAAVSPAVAVAGRERRAIEAEKILDAAGV